MTRNNNQQDFLDDLEIQEGQEGEEKTPETETKTEKVETKEEKSTRKVLSFMLAVSILFLALFNILNLKALNSLAEGVRDHRAAINALIENDRKIEQNFRVLSENAKATNEKVQELETKISQMETEYKGKVQKFEEIKKILSE